MKELPHKPGHALCPDCAGCGFRENETKRGRRPVPCKTCKSIGTVEVRP